MQNKFMFFFILMFVFSSIFACMLISEKNSDVLTPDKTSCELMKLEEVFPAEDGSHGNLVGDFAKDFSYSCPDGTLHKLSDVRGKKVVLIKFWARFCFSCMKSLPAFNNLHNKYSEKGLLVLSFNLQDSPSDILRIMQDEDYAFINVYDATPYFLSNYDAIPLNAMIDKDGKFQYIELSELPTEEQIENLLAELDNEETINEETVNEE